MNYSEDDLNDLRSLSIIFCMKRKAMFSPDQVVIKILETQIVDRLVVDVSEKFGHFFELFKRLGVCVQATADHYGTALERIYKSSQGATLHPNELKQVTDAVRSLFGLLESGSETEKRLSTQILYLPAEDISWKHTREIKVKLIDSRQLIVEVINFQKLRVKKPLDCLSVFVGFVKLGIKKHDTQREVSRLPARYRMKQWNDVVTQALLESCRPLAEEDSVTKRITELVHSEAIVYAVQRLANHMKLKQGLDFKEEEAKMVENHLHQITVLRVKGLKTLLTMNGSELPDTTQKEAFFIETNTPEDQTVDRTTLFVDFKQAISVNLKDRMLLRHVRMAVALNLFSGDQFHTELEDCLQNPLSATKILDRANISPFDRSSQTTVFPPPGSYVPISMHDLLDNDVYEFRAADYVAYELYDPVLESDDSAIGSGADTTDTEGETCGGVTAGIQTQSEKQPTYVYAKVVTVIEPGAATDASDVSSRLLKMQYVIDIGKDEPKQVTIFSLISHFSPQNLPLKTTLTPLAVVMSVICLLDADMN